MAWKRQTDRNRSAPLLPRKEGNPRDERPLGGKQGPQVLFRPFRGGDILRVKDCGGRRAFQALKRQFESGYPLRRSSIVL